MTTTDVKRTENSSAKTEVKNTKALFTVAGILLAIPFFGYIVLPLYDKVNPTLAGIPLFYWYQIIWLPISAVMFGIAAFLIARAHGGEEE